jgi:hypothetical protein
MPLYHSPSAQKQLFYQPDKNTRTNIAIENTTRHHEQTADYCRNHGMLTASARQLPETHTTIVLTTHKRPR